MAQLIDPLPSDTPTTWLCCYVNATSQIQVVRITDIANWYFERVVFPGQRLIFEAVPAANLEIHTGMMASSILSDTIPCAGLRLAEDGAALTAVESEAIIEPSSEAIPPMGLPQR
jgi:Domain of unknown function (DUF1830)